MNSSDQQILGSRELVFARMAAEKAVEKLSAATLESAAVQGALRTAVDALTETERLCEIEYQRRQVKYHEDQAAAARATIADLEAAVER